MPSAKTHQTHPNSSTDDNGDTLKYTDCGRWVWASEQVRDGVEGRLEKYRTLKYHRGV